MFAKETGFGIIGCGLIANWHADAIRLIGGAHLVGATDVSEDARNAFTAKYAIKPFCSAAELLACPEIDVVSICTPSGLHASLAVQASKAGKHIALEKPMAINLDQADRIIEACNENGTKLAVISQLRFTEPVRKLHKAVNEGAFGKLVSGDIYMKYHRSQDYYDHGVWKGTWAMDGGGALMNQGIHGVDLLRHIMGPVKSVFAHARTLARSIETEDTVSAVLEFRNGALGVIQATTSVYPGFPRRLEINGDKGSVVLVEDTVAHWETADGKKPEFAPPESMTDKSFNDPAAFDIEGHVLQLRDLADAVRNSRRPLVDELEGRKPLEIIMAVYESSKTGKMIDL